MRFETIQCVSVGWFFISILITFDERNNFGSVHECNQCISQLKASFRVAVIACFAARG